MDSTLIPNGIATSLEWVNIGMFTVEYNPKRYDLYASLFVIDDEERIRDMKLSPMYDFINKYATCKKNGEKFKCYDTAYYKMQVVYGRTHSYIVAKMSNFTKLFDNIEKNGVQKYPLVLPEGKKFQIKDGHHRITCCMVLGYKKLICKVVRGQI